MQEWEISWWMSSSMIVGSIIVKAASTRDFVHKNVNPYGNYKVVTCLSQHRGMIGWQGCNNLVTRPLQGCNMIVATLCSSCHKVMTTLYGGLLTPICLSEVMSHGLVCTFYIFYLLLIHWSADICKLCVNVICNGCAKVCTNLNL